MASDRQSGCSTTQFGACTIQVLSVKSNLALLAPRMRCPTLETIVFEGVGEFAEWAASAFTDSARRAGGHVGNQQTIYKGVGKSLDCASLSSHTPRGSASCVQMSVHV